MKAPVGDPRDPFAGSGFCIVGYYDHSGRPIANRKEAIRLFWLGELSGSAKPQYRSRGKHESALPTS